MSPESPTVLMDTTVIEMAEMSTTEMSVTPRAVTSTSPFLVKVMIQDRECSMLIDSGASHCVLSGRGFDTSRMEKLNLVARGFDGRTQQRTVSMADLEVRCSSSVVTVPFVFWQLNYDYDGILGRPWLEASNPRIDWPTRTLTWSADRQDPHSPQTTRTSSFIL